MTPPAETNPLKKMIDVLIVEDSSLLAKLLQDIISSDPQLHVVDIAKNGREAIEKVRIFKPDVITMDMCMDVLDGVEATRQIMTENPTPILIVTNSISRENSENIFHAFSYGALDVFDKGRIEFKNDRESRNQLIHQVKYLSGITVRPYGFLKNSAVRKQGVFSKRQEAADKIVAIVASTGGPHAISRILKDFDANFPCGILIVQHISKGFEENFMHWLNDECAIEARIPKHDEVIRPAVAYIAPNDKHLRVNAERRIELGSDPLVGGFRPSGDILLKSVAEVYGKNAISVILTGMGKDGAEGMMAVKKKHGVTIAQDEKSSMIFGMPKVAIEMKAVNQVLPLGMIPEAILRCLRE